MKISKGMINWLEVLKNAPPTGGEGGQGGGAILAPYMEYPSSNKELHFVQQWHVRGRSVHTDWRMEVDDHLVGWTVDTPGGIVSSPNTVEEAKKVYSLNKVIFKSSNKNQGFRGETKARQPKIWLTVEGIIKPGQVGSTKEHPGVFLIIDKGLVYFGTQKPYFHEYFLKSESTGMPFDNKDWTRVVVRAVNVNVIDPETKVPKQGTELMWRVLIPGDQTPYCIARGFKKKWVPPKGYIPVPPSWRTGDKYNEWETWVKNTWSGRGTETGPSIKSSLEKEEAQIKELSSSDNKEPIPEESNKSTGETSSEQVEGAGATFVVQYLSYMGQIVVRGIPNQTWFLRIKEGNKIQSWIAYTDLTRFSPIALTYEGTVSESEFSKEGNVSPNSKYNPSKTLTGKIEIIDRGSCTVTNTDTEGVSNQMVIFRGKDLHGKFAMTQEEKGSQIYTIEKLSIEELIQAEFVLQLHEIKTPEGLKSHHDIRVSTGFEFNLYRDPLTMTAEGDSCKAVFKHCSNVKEWMEITKPKTFKLVGPLATYVTPIDRGTVTLIDQNPPLFESMTFHGSKMKGYFVYKKGTSGRGGRFSRARLPHAQSLSGTGNPSNGDHYDPFVIEKKGGWDYFWLEIYDMKGFSKCESDPKPYLPDLSVPPEVQEILVCTYPRPGTLQGVKVSKIKFSDKWSETQASEWIKQNKLDTWSGVLIRQGLSKVTTS